MDTHCAHLSHPDASTTALASFLILGVLLSYLPQYIKIIRNRTSEGLSPWWVLLGGLSSTAAIGNITTLPASRADMACCSVISGAACAGALLGVVQIGCVWACFTMVVMLFLIFFPTEPDADLSSSTASLTSSPPPKRRDAVIVGSSVLFALLVVGITSIALVARWPHHTQTWANLLGSVAGVLATIQYVPQIWYTYRLGDVKSLSIITMSMQVPGAFLFAFSLWQRVGWSGWSTWLVYIITGFLQGMLLGMGIAYYLARKKLEKEEDSDGSLRPVDGVDGAGSDERTALLGNGNGTKSRPVAGIQRSSASQRQLGMLYAATPPEHDSDRSSSLRGQ